MSTHILFFFFFFALNLENFVQYSKTSYTEDAFTMANSNLFLSP